MDKFRKHALTASLKCHLKPFLSKDYPDLSEPMKVGVVLTAIEEIITTIELNFVQETSDDSTDAGTG